jgi:O-antigen/teichoic acid export membrane protein
VSVSSLAAADKSLARRFALWLTFLAIAAAFLISSMTLSALGVMYDAPGGSLLQKIHPATYLSLAALIAAAAARRDPLLYAADLTRRFPGAAFFVVNWILIVAYAEVFQHAPAAPLIDSFFCALAALVLYDDLEEGERARLRLLLHGIMFVNACLGLAEFAGHFRLTPFVAGGRLIVNDYRSTALLGHPLLNAATTSLYALMLFFDADRALKTPLRVALLVVQLAALVAFGGRTALVLTVVTLALGSLRPVADFLRGRPFEMRWALAGALAAPVLLAVVAALAFGGGLDPLMERFTDDRGSAEARVVMFDLFGAFSPADLLLGPDPERLASLQNTLGIEYGIENGWLGLLFQYGALMTLFFSLGFFALLYEFWRRSKSYGAVLVALFLIEISSSASISVKSFIFNQFAILLLVVFDWRAAGGKPSAAPRIARGESGNAVRQSRTPERAATPGNVPTTQVAGTMKENALLRNTLLYMPAQLLGPALQFAVTVIWTHLFDPALFGCVTFVVATQELTGGLGLGWWSVYMLRFRKGYADIDRFRSMDARVVACGAAAQAAFALPTLLMVGVRPDPALLAATAAYLATRTVLNHYGELARSDHRIGVYTIAQLATPIAGSGLSIIATLAFGADPAIALAAMALGQGLGVAATAVGLNLKPRLGRFDAAIFRQASAYGLPLVVSALFVWAASNGARVLVEAGEGLAAVGLFSVGWGLGQRLAFMLASLCNAASFPLAVDRLEAGDNAGALRHVAQNGANMIGLMAPATVGVAILSAPLVHLVVAAQFQAATVAILPIAMAAGVARALRIHIGDQTALLVKRTGSMTLFNFFDALVTLAGGAIGVHFGGVVGAAAGSLVGTCIGTLAAMSFVVARLGLRIPLRSLAGVLVGAAIMGAVLRLAPAPGNLPGLALQIVVGAAVYAAVILTLFPEARRLALAAVGRLPMAPSPRA